MVTALPLTIRKLALYYNTARHLRLIQVLTRLRKLTKRAFHFPIRRFSPERGVTPQVSENLIPLSQVLARRNSPTCKEVALQVIQNRFIFLNQSAEYKNGIRWNDPERSQLWRFNLHYFDYAFALGVTYQHTRDRRYYEKFRQLVEDWISENRIMNGDGWHPYTTSLRTVNWIYSYILFRDALDNDLSFRNLFLKSLFYQASHLARNLEFDLLGNHLITNAKALFFAGGFFNNQRWINKGISLLKDQAEEQILPDGGHFERSPMYHCIVLGDFLDCLPWFVSKSEDYLFLKSKLEQMLEFLAAILLPDGNIPLFNDSAYNIAPSPRQIFSYANAVMGYEQPERRKAFAVWEGRESGYYVVKNDPFYMIIDAGKIGPDYQPGHGHCDLFSYELALGNERMIVDSGVYEYEEGEMRTYCRSTKAHNTVMIDGKEQSEIWKSFRVARRAHPVDVQFGENDGSVFFSGWHDGYRRLGNQIVHARWMAFIDKAFWLVLDEIKGHGEHLAESFIHLHPDVRVSLRDDSTIVITNGIRQLTIVPFGEIETQWKQGWYCPEFGRRYPNTVLTLAVQAELPVCFGYLIAPGNVQQVEIAVGDQDLRSLRLDVHLEDKWYQINLNTKTVHKVREDGD